jgi:signal transduction histidine kinase
MSHELRTPLNAIGGHVQLVELGLHGPVTEAQRAALARVQGAGAHLLRLIDDVLRFARLEAGAVSYALAPTDLAAVLAEVMPMVEPQLASKGIRFEAAVPAAGAPDAPPPVRADPEKLAQVLINLLGNAAKFTPAGGSVAVRAEADADAVRLHVRDTGPGIAAERREAIFAPFVQGEAGHTRPHAGVGLGLAIARDLARGMGGELAVTSAPGAGSTFTVVLRRAGG